MNIKIVISFVIVLWGLLCYENHECSLFRIVQGHEGPISGMCCDASGGLLATAGNDGKVMVWDVDGGFCTHYFKGHTMVVSTVMFHSDPKKLLVSNRVRYSDSWMLMRGNICLNTMYVFMLLLWFALSAYNVLAIEIFYDRQRWFILPHLYCILLWF